MHIHIYRKTKEVLDTMYSNCHFNYIKAVLALLKVNLCNLGEMSEHNKKIAESLSDGLIKRS